MSILESLYIVFKGDASQLKKESKEVEALNNKTAASFTKVDKASSQGGETFLGVARSLARLIAGSYSFGAVIGGFRSSVDYAAKLDQASKALNVNAEALDAWGNAVRLTGGTTEGFQSSLRGLAGHLGTTANRALIVLPKLADAFHRMNQFRAMNFGKMLGLDEPTILLLQKGRREVDAIIQRQKELGIVTKRQAELARAYNIELGNTTQAFRSLSLAVGEEILPTFNKFLVLVQDIAIYFRSHADFVVGALIAIAGGATIAAIAFGLLSLPILAVVAAIGLFALAYEDVAVWLKDGDSLLGRAIKRWPLLGAAIQAVAETFKLFKQLLNGEDIAELSHNAQRFQSNNISRGQDLLDIAGKSSFNSQTSNSIWNNRSATGGDTRVDISQITINTQATDAEGVGQALGRNIQSYFGHAISNADDGIYI